MTLSDRRISHSAAVGAKLAARPSSASTRRRAAGRIVRHWQEVVLAAPGFTLYLVLIVGSVAVACFYSLTDWNGVSPDLSFIGLANYANIPSDPDVGHAFLITAIIAASGTVVTNVLAIPIAVLLESS